MFGRFLPRETSFFDFFEQHAALTIEGAKEFLSLVTTGANISAKCRRISDIEHETDTITHRCVEALHKTFITPIDRDSIHRLITRMDDVMDYVEAAMRGLRQLKDPQATLKLCIDINRLENEADAILRRSVARLFKDEKDPIIVIKWKEIYENLEMASDRCEDVANIIEGVILEHG